MGVLKNDSGSVRVGCLEPNEVANLVVDFDPYFTFFNNLDPIDIITDIVSGYTFEQVNAGDRLTFFSDAANNYPRIVSSGSRFMLNANTIESIVSGNYTMFCVVKLANSSLEFIKTNESFRGFTFRNSSNFGLNYSEYNADTSVRFNAQSPANYVSAGVYTICMINITRGGAGYLRSNLSNRFLFNSSVPTFIASASNVSLIGGITGSNARDYLRLLMYNRALSEAEENRIFNCLRLKYKI